MRWCIPLAFMLMPTGALGQTWQEIDSSDSQVSQSVTSDGIRVTIQELKDGSSDRVLAAAVQYPARPTKIISLGPVGVATYSQIGIGKLSSIDAHSSVILKTFSGGAHCCFDSKILQPQGEALNVIEFGAFDASSDYEGFPKDIDKDGIADFVMADGAFAYSFTKYAASWLPPKIMNVFKGNVLDVSDQPAFRPLFEDFSGRAKKACSDQTNAFRNGACAAYVASEAKLGRLKPALEFAVAHARTGSDDLPTECARYLANYQCAPGQLTSFTNFSDAIRWFLQKHQYM